MGDIQIDPQFRVLIPPFSPQELAGLEDRLIYEGCRDTSFVIVRWPSGEAITEEPQEIAMELLIAHPDNPRLVMHEEVIGPIAAQIVEHGFEKRHAITVRPFGDKFQVIAGHHRVEAARRAGLTKIPCWNRGGMSDEEALMELVLSNAQSELSQLEYGLHALTVIGKAKPGRGKKGGYSEYARRIGKDVSLVSLLARGAEVFKSLTRVEDLLDRGRHLAEIHAAGKQAWPVLVDAMMKGGWSVRETEQRVAEVKKFAIPDRWVEWLPYEDVVRRHLTANFAAVTVDRLIREADDTLKLIDEMDGSPDDRAEYMEWLRESRPIWDAQTSRWGGGNAWDMRELVAKREEILQQLRARVAKAEREREESWLSGSWREHVYRLKDGSVSLLLTDPPYGIAYQSHRHDKIVNDASPEQALREFEDMLAALFPKLEENAQVNVFCHWRYQDRFCQALKNAGLEVRDCMVWMKNQMGQGDLNATRGPMWEGIIHATKGSPVLYGERHGNVYQHDRVPSGNHPTEKPVALLKQLIEEGTIPGQLVVDPFGGVASTLVAANESGRRFWGCEIEQSYHEIGRRRIG